MTNILFFDGHAITYPTKSIPSAEATGYGPNAAGDSNNPFLTKANMTTWVTAIRMPCAGAPINRIRI